MNNIELNESRTVSVGYINKVCRRALKSEVYDCRDTNCMMMLFEFLTQRNLGFQLNYHPHFSRFVFQIKIYTGGEVPHLFKGKHEKPPVAAALALMQAIEES